MHKANTDRAVRKKKADKSTITVRKFNTLLMIYRTKRLKIGKI